jgi:hypothetical protein
MHFNQQEMSQKEAPNPKPQAPKKPQVPSFKSSAPLDFEAWIFPGVWVLKFGVLSCYGSSNDIWSRYSGFD